jgi:hypothetical protein
LAACRGVVGKIRRLQSADDLAARSDELSRSFHDDDHLQTIDGNEPQFIYFWVFSLSSQKRKNKKIEKKQGREREEGTM